MLTIKCVDCKQEFVVAKHTNKATPRCKICTQILVMNVVLTTCIIM